MGNSHCHCVFLFLLNKIQKSTNDMITNTPTPTPISISNVLSYFLQILFKRTETQRQSQSPPHSPPPAPLPPPRAQTVCRWPPLEDPITHSTAWVSNRQFPAAALISGIRKSVTQADTCSLLRLVTKTPHSGKSPQSLPGVGGGGGSAGAQSLQDSLGHCLGA